MEKENLLKRKEKVNKKIRKENFEKESKDEIEKRKIRQEN